MKKFICLACGLFLIFFMETGQANQPVSRDLGATFVNLPIVSKTPDACTISPVLLEPTGGSHQESLIPIFKWNIWSVQNANFINLEIAQDLNFTRKVFSHSDQLAPGDRSHQFSRNLDPGVQYYWRVYLECVGGSVPPRLESSSFLTGTQGTFLPAPSLLAPLDGSREDPAYVTLKWMPVTGAVGYQVVYAPVESP